MTSYNEEPRVGWTMGTIYLSVAATAAFGIFDGLRSVGQNTEAKSLGDHARTVVLADFNVWEQTKDYLLPQETHEDPNLTNNEDRAPLFDPDRNLDLGHLVILLSDVAVAVAWKVRD